MIRQVRNFVLNVTTKVNVYQLMALGLVLGAAIIQMPIGGGGGSG